MSSPRLQHALLAVALLPAAAAADDWPSYNRDVLGSRHNPGEKTLTPANVGKLEEKWRFPAKDSPDQIGVIHATPVVVGGYVYFGTATDPTFFKLAPDGKVCWTYRNPNRGVNPLALLSKNARFQSSAEGVFASALVEGDTVYFGDIGGMFYALDKATGKERWKLNARAKDFPDAHPVNCFFASPILADGKLIVGGGTLEQIISAYPFYRGNNGRGFVLALDPKTGKLLWKYDLGPKPEAYDPPMIIKDAWGEHRFHYGPGTSSIWSTPSYDAETNTIFFGTDVNTAPRRPTKDDPRLHTRESCAVVALNVRDGKERWVYQINPGDVWTNAMRSYDPKDKSYKDLSVGDTPKLYTIPVAGAPTKVVGVGCKNGGFYVLNAASGKLVANTPIYTGPPTYPLTPKPDPRTIALPSVIGGLQTGIATDGKTIFTNGIDAIRLMSAEKATDSAPPTGGRVVAISLDTKTERWRHERPRVPTMGGPKPKPVFADVGDPVGSGVAVANGVVYFTTQASNKLVAVDATTGSLLKEIDLGPVWAGPSVSRGRVYVGSGNTLFNPNSDGEAFFPKKATGVLYSFGLPGEDEVSRLGKGKD